jgi:hypothetical protein
LKLLGFNGFVFSRMLSDDAKSLDQSTPADENA